MASLLLAVSAGNLSETKRLLDDGHLPDAVKNSNGHTPIFLAAHLGHSDIFQHLLSAKAAVLGIRDNAGNSVLHLANHPDIVKKLISLNLDINSRNKLGRTPLHCAILRRNFDVAYIHVEHGCDINAQDIDGNTCLHFVSKCYHYINMDILRSNYDASKVNDRNYIISYMKRQQVGGFHHALLEHDQDLFDYICHVAKCTKTHKTEKEIIEKLNSHAEFLSLAEILISHGSDPSLLNHLGQAPLHWAVDGSNIELIKLLCKAAPSTVNMQDNIGKTPLVRCYSLADNYHDVESNLNEQKEKQRKASILEILVQNGADLELLDINGFGILYFASHSYDYLQTVLKYSPNIDVRSCTGASVLHLLASETNTLNDKVITLLLKMGLDINCRDNYGATPLFYASWACSTKWIESLLKHGSQLDIVDQVNNTAYDLSLFNKQMDIAAYLTSHLEQCKIDQVTLSDESSHQKFKENCLNLSEKNVLAIDNSSDVDKLFHSVILPAEGTKYICDILESPVTGRTNVDEENIKINQAVSYLTTKIGEQFATFDPRFKMRTELSGSVSEGVKCGRADEFDILCCLEEFENLLQPEESELDPPGFVRIERKSTNAAYDEFFTKDGYLISSKLEETFYKCLYHALHSPDVWKSAKELFPSLGYVPELTVKGPSADLTLRWFGAKFKDLFISIDMVPAFRFTNWWPVIAKTNLRGLGDLNTNGCHVVLTTYHDKQHKEESIAFNTQVPRHFRISFSQVERRILQTVPQEVRDGFILAKTLRGECPPIESAFPTSDSESIDSDDDTFEVCGIFEVPLEESENEADAQCSLSDVGGIDQDVASIQDRFQIPQELDVDIGVSTSPLHASLISTYMLKMSLFHELEREGSTGKLRYDTPLANPEAHIDSQMACAWAKRIYERLGTFVREGSLPSFFVPNFDLMNRKDSSDVHVFDKSMISEEEIQQTEPEAAEVHGTLSISEEHQPSILTVPNEINDYNDQLRHLFEIEDGWYSARDNSKRAEIWTRLRKFSPHYQEELLIFISLIQKILTESTRVS